MAANMNDLADYMDRLNDRVAVYASSKSVEIASAILGDLLRVTPADTGTALSNWQLSVGSPAISVVPAFVPSPKGKRIKGIWTHLVPPLITQQANAPFVLNAAFRILATKKPGQAIFITNNVEYIQELNSGTSQQAPAAFVERAQIIGRQIADRARITP